MAHFGLNFEDALDLYQQAVYAILHGRNPNSADLADRDAFLNYIRGAINSVVEGWARTFRREGKKNCSLDLIPELVAPVDTNVEFSDLKEQLFARLRRRAPARLLPTIDAWEKAPDGRIPCVTSRKHVFAVRQMAQRIAVELGMVRTP